MPVCKLTEGPIADAILGRKGTPHTVLISRVNREEKELQRVYLSKWRCLIETGGTITPK
ncbi:hypothetical protein SAMN05660413_03174 [Salegentibacter flavus]|uniref:Uncharacterized protein n=1 Tax=Salegentibacter flavus TaxID=287099 RepID=A0A1I5D4Y6_9FLAO|nr:hypothetical protein SAMN05660413_03174 [Salegentibacter flavus]